LKNGTFPQSLLDAIAKTDKHENISLRRILEFTEKEKEDLIGDIKYFQTSIVTRITICKIIIPMYNLFLLILKILYFLIEKFNYLISLCYLLKFIKSQEPNIKYTLYYQYIINIYSQVLLYL